MPKESKAQGRAAGMALAMKRGEMKTTPGTPAAKMAGSMDAGQLKDFAKGSEKGLPKHKKPPASKQTNTGGLKKRAL